MSITAQNRIYGFLMEPLAAVTPGAGQAAVMCYRRSRFGIGPHTTVGNDGVGMTYMEAC